MYEYMNIKNKPIAIILIRSGSRGIHNKNIRPLAGKPLVFYTLEVAFASGLFSQIWVSSDSLTYLDICKKFYPDVKCILRAKKLALSTTSTLETLQDFLKPFDDNQIFFNLQVTSPLRVVNHLIEAYKLYLHSGADHLISCAKADKSRSLYLQMHDHYFIQQPKINKYYTRQKEQSIIIQMVVYGFPVKICICVMKVSILIVQLFTKCPNFILMTLMMS